MNTQHPTVDELNEIQREWMALDSGAPEKEKRRVLDLMAKYPRVYISGHDGLGVVMIQGCPLNQPMPFADCLKACRMNSGRTDVAWNGRIGAWYAL